MRRKIGYYSIKVLLVSVLIIGLNVSAYAADELKIGILGPLSGPVAFAGKTLANAATLAAEEVNAAGGITVAGKKYKIKMVAYDTKYSVSAAKSSAERMIFEDKVKFIFGALSLDTKGFQKITEQNKVIIFPAGGGILPSSKTPYTFRSTTLVNAKYTGLYTYLKNNLPSQKKVAFINPDTPVGEAYADMSRKAAEPLGFKVVAAEFIASGTSDFSPVITKIISKKPDFIDLGGTGGGSDSALIIKQARELGFKGLMVCAVGLQSKAVLQVAGAEAMEGVIETGFTAQDPAVSDAFRKVAERYGKRFPGLPFIDLTSEIYDTTKGFLQFLDGQETLDTTVLKDRLSNYSWKGIYGVSSFGGKKTFGIKNQVVHPAYLSQWKGGKPIIIDTVPAPVP